MTFHRLAATFVAITLVLAACTTPVDLQVTSYAPTDGATGVSVDAVVTATFNVAIDEASVDGNFALTSSGGAVDGAITYDPATRTATFDPTDALAYSTLYTVTVSGSVATTGGVTLGGDATWSFTTEAAPIVDAIGGIDVTPATSEVVVGETVQLVATPTGVTGTPDLGVTWTSSDETVATVDADGLVTTVAEGSVTITATSDFDDAVFGTATVDVLPFSIGSYTIDGPEAPLAIAATAQLTATPVDVVGSPDTSVTWSSGDEAVATIDPDTGEVTAVAAGTATMTATSNFDPNVFEEFEIEVATLLVATGIEDEGVIAGYIADLDAGTALDPVLPAPFSGGVAPYTFEVVTPEDAPFALQGVPTGMTLDLDTGELSGTPTVARFYNFAVEATDAIGQTAIAYGEVEVFLVLTLASDTYVYDPAAAPVTVVPETDVTVVGADPADDFTFTLDLVSTDPAGGVATDWSIDTFTGAITYDELDVARVWTFDVTVVDEVFGGTATFQVVFEPLPVP